MAGRTLTCPLCRGDATPAIAAGGGECPSCGALVAGGGASPGEGVALALGRWGVEGLDARSVALRLFETDPAAAPAPAAAIASDEGEGFYAWWVVVRPGEGGPGPVLAAL
ncbi:hypothetical protein [Miltoncostaea marina]|uniref:hypothetical protein n=1 Tax=Miltoncostaea marina TaxID=2843215 RepID=UPI001C3D557E|nr:hypothetical protein [Miltoncostaea marina]